VAIAAVIDSSGAQSERRGLLRPNKEARGKHVNSRRIKGVFSVGVVR